MKYLSCLLVFFIACSASLQSLSNEDREKITTRTYGQSYKEVFNACIEHLEQKGFILDNLNLDLGIITTEYKQNTNMVSKALIGKSRAKAMIRIKNLGKSTKVIFTPQMQIEDYFGSWETVEINRNNFDNFFKGIENKFL